ncbi:proton-coupled zinc antiporter SLC30A2 isoform X2 [Tursiops truncatus]|uniref:Proton-coupled zinc antiporter SLC30A2 n=1 Tax=Tursiops truncatus TaxID=9739 RepID=A0A6J3Q2F2_TURTR|nr:zinc transporter 2 isoform X2 [Tursiops truncatus]
MEATERKHLLDARLGAGSYRSLWQDGAGRIPLSSPGLDLQTVELATKSNHYCHAQTGPGSDCDLKKKRAWRQLCVACAFCLLFMIGEVVGGYLAHSLAIMTDAAHLLTDFASMLISLFSLWMSSRPATKTMNFGWHRAEILGALISVLSIWVVTGVLVYLAVERLISGDYELEKETMLITSGCAVVVNIIMGLILHQSGHGHSHGHEHSHDTSQQQENPSVRAAFIHVVGDFLQSLGVLVAAFILYFKPEYKFIDPICTFLFSILVLGTTLTILRDVILVLMEVGSGRGRLRIRKRQLVLDKTAESTAAQAFLSEDPTSRGRGRALIGGRWSALRDPQGHGLHGCAGSAAVGGGGGSPAQPAYLGADCGPAYPVCPCSHRYLMCHCCGPAGSSGSDLVALPFLREKISNERNSARTPAERLIQQQRRKQRAPLDQAPGQ